MCIMLTYISLYGYIRKEQIISSFLIRKKLSENTLGHDNNMKKLVLTVLLEAQNSRVLK